MVLGEQGQVEAEQEQEEEEEEEGLVVEPEAQQEREEEVLEVEEEEEEEEGAPAAWPRSSSRHSCSNTSRSSSQCSPWAGGRRDGARRCGPR